MLTGNLNLTVDIESQRAVWFIFPLFPIFLIFFIGSVAETNRAPFDLAEAIFWFGLIKDHKLLENLKIISRKATFYKVESSEARRDPLIFVIEY